MIINGKSLLELAPIKDMETSKKVFNGLSYGLSEAGYDIRLKQNIIFHPNTYHTSGDGESLSLIEPSKVYVGSEDMIPGNFCLASAIEEFNMPSNLLGVVHDKSSNIRQGIQVFNTVIEPCMHPSTEVLTKDGWKFIADLSVGEEVLTLNRETHKAEYQKIIETQCVDFEGELLHFKGRSIDQLVTPNHKLWIRTATTIKGKKEYKWVYDDAINHFGKYDRAFSRKVDWEGKHYSYFEELNIDGNTFFQFLGAYLGDGSSYIQKGGHIIKLAVVTKDVKRDYYRELLTKMGVKFNEHEHGFYFYSKVIFNIVNPLGHAKDKRIPTWVKNASKENLTNLVTGLMNSDGNKETNTYTTTSKRLADDIQEVFAKSGGAGTIWEQPSKIKEGEEFLAYKIRNSGERSLVNITNPKKHVKVPYTGKVYDITVPNHVFMTRREGKMSWTGNCWKGFLTLEIAFHGNKKIFLKAGTPIAQVIFHELKEESSYEGKYQNQPNKPVEAIKEGSVCYNCYNKDSYSIEYKGDGVMHCSVCGSTFNIRS